jgi:hypothetical protein
MRFVRLSSCWVGVLSYCLCGGLAAQTVDWRPTELVNGHKAVANEVLVQFKAAVAEKNGEMTLAEQLQSERIAIGDITAKYLTEYVRPIGGAGWYLVHSHGFSADALAKSMGSRVDVAYVEPNYLIKPATDSVAQYYAPYQWALKNTGQTINGPAGASTGSIGADIKASQAWDLTTGFRTTVIATIDPTGIDYTHPDLSTNIWSAPSSYTVVVGGVQYTCPSGSHGFQFVNNSQLQGACDPLELYNQPHGTILAGIMGANGASSIGVSGINWSTSVIHINGATDADVVNGIDFLIQTKNHFGAAANIRVINNSYLIPDASQAVLQEINVANSNGMLFVAAAGNGGNSNDPPGGTFPANFGAPPYNAPNVISVANTDNHDNLCESECSGVASAWGGQSVHLGAPGWAIASTMPGNAYNINSLYIADLSTGTSASAPYVTGTAALVLSRCADLNTSQLRQNLLDGVDYVAGLFGCTNPNGSNYCTITRGTTPSGQQGGGRLNAYKAVSTCGYTLSVSKSGTGSGTVTSNASGTVAGSLNPINCGAVCSAVFKSTTYGASSVTLTATPAAGSVFTGWSGICSGTGTCVIAISAPAAVTATFAPSSIPLTVTKAGTGSGTVTSSPAGINCGSVCSFNFATGTQVNLTATPNAGSVFTGFTGCSSLLGLNTCSVTLTSATSVTATFQPAVTLTGTVTGTGSGMVCAFTGFIIQPCPPSVPKFTAGTQSVQFAKGTTVTLVEIPVTSYPNCSVFGGWGGACSGTASTCRLTLSASEAFTASFAKNPICPKPGGIPPVAVQ